MKSEASETSDPEILHLKFSSFAQKNLLSINALTLFTED